MSNYAVAHLDEIDEQNDGRCPWRPIRAHFGVTSFGATTWTARAAGDRLINEHDEPEDEELYLVTTGRAVFELDGDRIEAPSGTFVFAPPGVKRTALPARVARGAPRTGDRIRGQAPASSRRSSCARSRHRTGTSCLPAGSDSRITPRASAARPPTRTGRRSCTTSTTRFRRSSTSGSWLRRRWPE